MRTAKVTKVTLITTVTTNAPTPANNAPVAIAPAVTQGKRLAATTVVRLPVIKPTPHQ
ncbi:MAG: hypothetical protein GF308_16035 [Candidatus Heimdallarchaeota archaeon]|nr:hypothetical protein [Candidatus Heimdallarchaeota archaeon]